MRIINKTKQTTLAETYLKPKSLFKQSLGLLLHKTPVAMLLYTRFGVHTLFMRYPIDVLILDKTNSVVALKENMPPNDYFVWNPKYNKILELPTGTIKETQTEIGDEITLV